MKGLIDLRALPCTRDGRHLLTAQRNLKGTGICTSGFHGCTELMYVSKTVRQPVRLESVLGARKSA